MTFEEYLVKKKINRAAFEAEDKGRYTAWEDMYAQMHPNSFYMAVKMVLNDVRLRYHLREEDIPKAAPATTAAARPAARRAVPQAPRTAEAPTPELPTLAAASEQEETEATKAAPALPPKPRPVIGRPAALKAPGTREETAAQENPADEPASSVAPRPRPVIKRPVVPKPDTAEATGEITSSGVEAAPGARAEEPTPAPRPRPVIRRPAALQKPAQEVTEGTPTAVPPADQPTSEPEAETPHPPRARPVIKRPAALQKPAEREQPDPKADENKNLEPDADVTPKPPRPRPIIKRPAALAPVPEVAQITAQETPPAETSPAEQNPADTEQVPAPKPAFPRPRPVIKRPASAAPAAAEAAAQIDSPPAEPAQTGMPADEHMPTPVVARVDTPSTEDSAPAPKPPRPRPIIKPPVPPTAVQEASKAADAPEETQPGARTEETAQNMAPKPPRPRPIMRRPPPKPDEGGATGV